MASRPFAVVDADAVGGWVATRDVFSEDEPVRLRTFPEVGCSELIRHFTSAGPDEAFLREFRTGRNVLGAAVQSCTPSRLGCVPDKVTGAPSAAVGRLSQRLGGPTGELGGYGEREQTRTDHLREVVAYCAAGGYGIGASGRTSMSSCSRGRWSTIPRSCCSGRPANTCRQRRHRRTPHHRRHRHRRRQPHYARDSTRPLALLGIT
ncbi:DUF4158 domain-containing protein [Streptomyces sp. NBC_01334]|uniref:DUF4158 domain-containing protein n=1 Tax=Streptomyces sp. NBC_01334 TaxID=2903827 RepID=UPI002E139DAA|nr:DUF4158 domain-containing protein [Streptomyces sp. NBC_01334]